MKLIGKHIDKDGSGHVTIRPEDDEDMWHLYNLIQEIKYGLQQFVTRTNFSPSTSASATTPGLLGSSQDGAALQVTGRVTVENTYVKMGAYHTLDIETNRDVRLVKDDWDTISLERITESCVEGRGAEVGAIVCGEGTAALCLLSEHMTIIRQQLEVPVPRKRTGSSTLHDKGLERFYSTLNSSFLRHIPFSTLRVVVIASPGFVKDAVYDYIFAEASKTNNKALLQAKNKFVRVHVNSPHVHSLVEVLRSPEVSTRLKETKFAREGITLERFFKMLGSDEQRAWYGADHVELAVNRGAVGTLLISDGLFRANNPIQRKRFVALVEDVRGKGGEVLIFSSMHESGQQLNQLTGIAAILTFPLDIEVVEAEERDAKLEQEAMTEETRKQ